jgi:hypothetical protein
MQMLIKSMMHANVNILGTKPGEWAVMYVCVRSFDFETVLTITYFLFFILTPKIKMFISDLDNVDHYVDSMSNMYPVRGVLWQWHQSII